MRLRNVRENSLWPMRMVWSDILLDLKSVMQLMKLQAILVINTESLPMSLVIASLLDEIMRHQGNWGRLLKLRTASKRLGSIIILSIKNYEVEGICGAKINDKHGKTYDVIND